MLFDCYLAWVRVFKNLQTMSRLDAVMKGQFDMAP